MLVMATNNQVQQQVQDSINTLSLKMNYATNAKDQRASELHTLQSHNLLMLPLKEIPALTISSEDAPMHDANPEPTTSSHKRMQTSMDDEDDN